jgi:hypothetical protein
MHRRAISITGKRPYVLVSEGAQNFNQAFKDEFFTRRSPGTRHIQLRLQGDHNNNKKERCNGKVRGRQKVIRGLKKSSDSKILDGYIPPHQGVGGDTSVIKKYMSIMTDMTPITIFKSPPDSDPLYLTQS